ncbi:bacteriocin-associated integral membrane family protein [Staphylococcus aureus]|uniref:bacteriocin-associated integral membrane family protein n=1 Tax=Staphylococcus aureus TaxID=1280 RepID=UPI00044E6A84|nr:DUF1430 domain-containing protein [Staphylococcus aureus]EGQ0541950.1 bacteriocin-associated integral membrane family protein [Staphylococcus aureus]EZY69320.1 hypothetical protein V063_02477 [Staphylococcus aureus R0487]MCR0868870.1 DUF1430 domain-containing protein [Staphylococcus aureus]MCS5351914.1 DUF1430 domain-containing protein [Staphylococcus aureus]HCX3193472.1 bacteriocin-associated integral membrane family protein [Staphylococcus aureus]
MKKFKLFLDFSTLLLISGLLFLFSFKESEEIIPESSNILTISNWDKSNIKPKVLDAIESSAKKHNIQIVKLTKDFDNKKSIFVFNAKRNHHELIKNKTSLLTSSDLLNKEIKGKYYIVGESFNTDALTNELNKVGLTADVEYINRNILFFELVIDNDLLVPFIFLGVLYLLYFLYDRGHHLKFYAVQKLHGFSPLRIIFHNIHLKIIYWLVLTSIFFIANILIIHIANLELDLLMFVRRFIVLLFVFACITTLLWLISYSLLLKLSIPLTLKGKKGYKFSIFMGTFTKCIMVLILSFLLAQNLNAYTKLKNIYDSEKIWKKLENYYTLEISPNIRNSEEKQRLETNIYNLIKKSEQLGGLLLKNNNIANPDKNNYIPENGNVFFINNNFLNFYKDINHDFKMIDNHSDKINVFIPPRLQSQKSEIQDNHQGWIDFQKQQNKKVDVQVLSKNVSVFSFDRTTNLKFGHLNSPIVMLLTPEDLTGDFYLAAVSQGGYLFKDLDTLKQLLKDHHLEDEISGVTNYKDSVLNELNETKSKMIITMFTIIINIFIILIATVFETIQYFSWNKKQLLLQKIHGYSLLSSNIRYLTISILLSIMLAYTVHILFGSKILLLIIVSIAIIQHLLQIAYIKYLEKYFKDLMREI